MGLRSVFQRGVTSYKTFSKHMANVLDNDDREVSVKNYQQSRNAAQKNFESQFFVAKEKVTKLAMLFLKPII